MAVRNKQTGDTCKECGSPLIVREHFAKDFDGNDFVQRRDPTTCHTDSCSEHARRTAW